MRPLSLEFQAFGPYAGREYIDFQDLSRKGLLLICGDTGSGKTMILDAMTLALYGKASGGVRNDFRSLRCNRCAPEDDTFIQFVFEAGGNVYKFERRLKQKRVNLSEEQQIYRMDGDGSFEPLYEKLRKNEMVRAAEEIVGLDYDQFTQVIILPQGKFEQFLEADSGQKGEILTEIFGAGRWDRIARKYYEQVYERHNEITGLKDKVNSILDSENCASIEELGQKIEELKVSLKELEENYSASENDESRRKLQSEKERAGRIRELREASQNRRKALESAEKTEEKRKQDLEIAEKALAEHNRREPEKEALRDRISELESKRGLYTSAEEVRDKFSKAEKQWKDACSDAEESERALLRAQDAEKDALRKYQQADRQHTEALAAFAKGAAGRLAAELKEGEKCPVCGSTIHPEPAELEEGSVSSAQVDKMYRAVGDGHDAWEKARQNAEKARETAGKQREAVAVLETEKTAAQRALEDSRAGMLDGISSLKELNQCVNKVKDEISAFDRKTEELSKAAEKSRISLAEAKTAREKETLEAEKAAGLYEDMINRLAEETGSREEPDTGRIEAEIRRLEQEAASYQREHGSMTSGIERLNGVREKLAADWETYNSNIADAEDDLAFARQLRGDSGIGLMRYVLGIMFDQVVYAANEMLSKVHGGRYSLVRTEDSLSGSRKKGLELAVTDSFSDTDEIRAAGSLSGGEKFLVSLALSIGMSTIARTDGINIDAMFIDEGFGSLDESSIGDALDVLESIRSDSGGTNSFIGIISHVQILRESIPSKLFVKKGRKTSHIEYTLG